VEDDFHAVDSTGTMGKRTCSREHLPVQSWDQSCNWSTPESDRSLTHKSIIVSITRIIGDVFPYH
jgi:hypothetical protein